MPGRKNFVSSLFSWIRIIIPFSCKLAATVALIVLGSTLTITTLVSALESEEFGRIAENNNAVINSRSATAADEKLYKVRSDALLLLDITGSAEGYNNQTMVHYFERIQDIAVVAAPGRETHINHSFFRNREANPGTLLSWIELETEAAQQAARGKPVLRNATVALGIPLIAMFYPWQERGLEEAIVICFLPDRLADVFGDGQNFTVMVNDDGDVLIHPDISMILSGANIANSPLFDTLRRSGTESVQQLYRWGGKRFYGAACRLSFAGASVLSSIEYDLVTDKIRDATRRNVSIALAAMFIAVLAAWFLSRLLTFPVRKIIAATHKIEQGDFSTELTSNSNDEIGMLIRRFNNMCKSLQEWRKASELVGRFNNGEITVSARKGTLNLAGEAKLVTMLHLEFLSLDALSKKFDPAELLVRMNDCFSKMADGVEKTGGVVDSIFGHRMIAIWGAPVSSGSHASDAMNAVSSALTMRAALWELNKDREEGTAPLFRMSCGIHTGELIAGGIGHPGHTRYSFIGTEESHAVHAAAMGVSMSTDIVITRAVKELIGDQLVYEELYPKEGITEHHNNFFALVNTRPQESREKPQWPYTLDDVRESLGILTHGG